MLAESEMIAKTERAKVDVIMDLLLSLAGMTRSMDKGICAAASMCQDRAKSPRTCTIRKANKTRFAVHVAYLPSLGRDRLCEQLINLLEQLGVIRTRLGIKPPHHITTAVNQELREVPARVTTDWFGLQ